MGPKLLEVSGLEWVRYRFTLSVRMLIMVLLRRKLHMALSVLKCGCAEVNIN